MPSGIWSWCCCCGPQRGFQRGLTGDFDGDQWSSWAKHPVREIYSLKEELGEGAFSKVVVGVHNETGVEAAIKVVFRNTSGLKFEHWAVLRQEVQALEACVHPNIVSLYDSYEDRDHLVLVLEHLKGGELLEHIQEIRHYTEHKAALLFVQLAQALKHIHSQGYIHRDLKPENVLFVRSPTEGDDESYRIKLIDLGMATVYNPNKPIRAAMGTAGFLSPECCHKVPHAPAMDMWSLGIMLFVMLCGRMPYSNTQIENLLYPEIDIRRSPGYRSSRFRALSPPAKSLLLRLLERNPKARATAEEVLLHPWVVAMGRTDGEQALGPAVAQDASKVAKRRDVMGMANCAIASTSNTDADDGYDETTENTSSAEVDGKSALIKDHWKPSEVEMNDREMSSLVEVDALAFRNNYSDSPGGSKNGFRGSLKLAQDSVTHVVQDLVSTTTQQLSRRQANDSRSSFDLSVDDNADDGPANEENEPPLG